MSTGFSAGAPPCVAALWPGVEAERLEREILRRLAVASGLNPVLASLPFKLSFDQVFIETRGADNPFREKRKTRLLFAPRDWPFDFVAIRTLANPEDKADLAVAHKL